MSRVENCGRWQMRFPFADPPATTPSNAASARVAPTRSTASRVYFDDPPAPLPGEYREARAFKPRSSHPRTRIGLPVPKALPEAIAAGHFGRDEYGKPIRPSRLEVCEITASHADAMAEALQQRRRDAFEEGITRYAESFGPEAAERLRSYAQRLARDPGAAMGRR